MTRSWTGVFGWWNIGKGADPGIIIATLRIVKD